MEAYEPSHAGKAVILGSPVLLVVLCCGGAALLCDHDQSIAIAGALLVFAICGIVYFVTIGLLKDGLERSTSLAAPLGRVTPLPASLEYLMDPTFMSREGKEFRGPQLTLDEFLDALTSPSLSDEEFAAEIRRHFPGLRPEIA